MTTNLRVLAIAGSLRRHSYNRSLLLAAAAMAPTGMEVAVYDRLASIPLFNEDLEAENAAGPESVWRLREEVARADGLLFATPEYNQSIPGVMKNVIDWLSRPGPEEVLEGKPVAVTGITAGRWGTRLAQTALRQTLHATHALVMPPALFIADAKNHFDESGRLIDTSARESLEELLNSLAAWIQRQS